MDWTKTDVTQFADVVLPGAITPPLTHGERYKREIREVGTERFRVRY